MLLSRIPGPATISIPAFTHGECFDVGDADPGPINKTMTNRKDRAHQEPHNPDRYINVDRKGINRKNAESIISAEPLTTKLPGGSVLSRCSLDGIEDAVNKGH